MAKKILDTAKNEKNNEFYTSLSDIELELKNYREQFKDKIIFCNCDDPYESNFFKYFAMNFHYLGLKKLIATCYDGSPVAGTQLSLFDELDLTKKAFKVEIESISDFNNDGVIDLQDVEFLLKQPEVVNVLESNGDFRSKECIELLKQADIVVTNPPFSLFREFISTLVEYNKDFIVIGNTNALTYKEIFSLFKENKIRTGYTKFNTGMFFLIPDHYEKYHHIDEYGNKVARVSTSCWLTSLPVSKHNEELILYKKYNPLEYQKFDNYDAINVDKYTEIPYDYDDVIGVPITFLDKYNPDQFEIVGIAKTPIGSHLRTKIYPKQKQYNKNGTTSFVTKLNDGPSIEVGTRPLEYPFYEVNGHFYVSKYARILIRRKKVC